MKQAVVAGGGIGGLAAALALANTGWQVRLYEAADALRETGAGIQISPNAARAMDWLGAGSAMRREGFQPRAAVMRDGRTGSPIYRAALGDEAEARWGAPYLHMHRGDLMQILADVARAAGVEIECGVRVTGYLVRTSDVRVDRVTDADVPLPPDHPALLVGADGIRSALRQQLNGREDPEFSGQVAWRALVETDGLPPELLRPDATVWIGPGRHLVTYLLRAGQLLNVVAVEEREDWAPDTWRSEGDPADLVQSFEGWHPDVARVLGAVRRAWIWGLYTRPEQVRWTEGRMALLGDAAHPMLPFMAQGAAQALEDAVALALALERHADVPTALGVYEGDRWPRAARVQAQSRANGRLFHRHTALGRFVTQAPIAAVSRLAPGFAAGRLDWLYGHDITA